MYGHPNLVAQHAAIMKPVLTNEMSVRLAVSKNHEAYGWIAENKDFKVYGDTKAEAIEKFNLCLDEPIPSDNWITGTNDTHPDLFSC